MIGFLIKNILLVIIISFFVIFIVNYRLKKSLKNYIGIEVERVVSHVINQSIRDINISSSDYIYLKDDNISYDMAVINEYKDKLSNRIQEYFSYIEKGDYTKYPSFTQQNS